MRIVDKIILVPRLDNPGGVANFYSVLESYLSEDITYLYRGRAAGKNKLSRLLYDYLDYSKRIRSSKISVKVVLISSSLGYGGFFRDGLYSLITKTGTKKIVFFRGWNPAFEEKIDKSWFLKLWLRKTFLKADHIIVLSTTFKQKLVEWGYDKSISIETTVVDEHLLADFDISKKDFNSGNLLFLSRIEKAKGIFEAAGAVQILLNKGRDIRFNIAGNGSAMDELKNHIKQYNTDRIDLKGYVKGEDKTVSFSSANIFIFPSYHEGMPNSVLEAMAFGLPILTTRVGGIPDFFEDGKMGLFLDNREPEHIAEKIEYLLDRPELMKQMSEYNYNYAKEHFYASKVAARLEKIIDDVVEGGYE